MTVYTDQAWGALVVFGLADPGSPQSGKGVVFTNGLFSLPADIPAATFTIRAWLTELGGETFTANLREPCSAGGGISAKIDDSLGSLSALLVPDPKTPGFYLEDARLLPSDTTIHLRSIGNTPPTVNQILWIEAEAVKVTAVTAGDTTRTWTVTVTRGVCGSFAVSHHLTPSVYWVPGSDGLKERILVTTKPVPSRHRFFARAYRLRDAGSSTVVSHYRDGYLSRQMSSINPPQWEFSFEPAGKLLEEHQVRERVTPTPLSRCVEVLTQGFVHHGAHRLVPLTANLWLRGKDASLLFDWPFRPCGSPGIDPDAVTEAQAVFVNSDYLVKLSTEAGDGTYTVTSLEAVAPQTLFIDLQTEFIRVGLAHRKSTIDLTDKVTTPFVSLGTASAYARYTGGFSEGAAIPLVADSQVPTAELWALPTLTVCDFFAKILGSDKGDSAGPFDRFGPGLGIGFPDSFINWDSPAVTPSLESLDLAELDQLFTQKWVWPLKPKTKVADLLNSICRLLRLVVTPKAKGGLTVRPWARPFTSTANPIKLEQTELTILQDVQPVRALEFVAGIDLLTFEPASKPRLATVQSTKSAERGDIQRVWVLTQSASALSDVAFAAGDIFECCRCFFITLQGEPMVLSGMTDLDVSAYETVDYVTLTDDAVPTSGGRGVVVKRYILISLGLSWNDSGQPFLALPDELNNEALQSVGKISPTLRITELRKTLGAGPYTVTVRVESIGDDTFDGRSDHGGIWDDILDNGEAYVRVIRPLHNTVTDATKDRQGWLECYATLQGIRYIGPESEFDLELSANWLHDGLTVEDYFFSSSTIEDIFITLMDVNTSNRLQITIEPIDSQWYTDGTGNDFDKFDGLLPVDGHRSLIGA